MTSTEISNAILELIDNADGFTRSDLQGVVDALALRISDGMVPKYGLPHIHPTAGTRLRACYACHRE